MFLSLRHFSLSVACLLGSSTAIFAQDPPAAGRELQAPPTIEWKVVAELPNSPTGQPHGGLAGLFSGAHGERLIIAGGTSFEASLSPIAAPKTYHKEILVLKVERSEAGEKFIWEPAGVELPIPLANGASVNTTDGFLMIGGRDQAKCYADCRHLSWDDAGKKVILRDFPALPKPLAHHAATTLGNVVYVAGGVEQPGGRAGRYFFSLDLTKQADPAAFVWKELPAWDGMARLDALLVSGFDGDSEDVYLCGGRNPGGLSQDFLSDLHRFDPQTQTWSILGNALDPKGNVSTFMASPTFYVPPHHLVMIGSTDQHLTGYIESVGGRLAATEDPVEKADCQKLIQMTLDNFPGYSRNVMAFDMRTSEWSRLGAFPDRPPVATPSVPWQGGMVLVSGETGPGKRTNKIWEARVKKKARVVQE